MINTQNLSDILLFIFDNIIFMILNFMNSYSRIKYDSLTSEEKQRCKNNNLYLYYIDLVYKIFEYPHASKRNLSYHFINEI